MPDDRYRIQSEAFIAGVIKADNPDVVVDGTAIGDLVVKAGGAIATATTQEIEHLRAARDISDPEAISVSDMNKNLAGLLVDRDAGDFSSGPINIHFQTRAKRVLTSGMRVSSKDGAYVYVLPDDLSFQEFDYIANPDDGTYYVRASFNAIGASADYDLDVGQINVIVDNSIGALYCRNPEKFQNGASPETNTQYLRKVARGISTRLPQTIDGSTFLLQQLFGLKLLDVLAIGNGDPEMRRDELHRQGNGELDLVSTGTPSGIHIGGRQDIYHWYKRMNYVEVTVDLSVDLAASSAISNGANTISASFVAGTTTPNSVPAAGKLVLELGGGNEETVYYSSRVFTPLTQTYAFTLSSPTTRSHAQGTGVKVAGDGTIAVGPGAKLNILPLLRIQSITLLDPLTLAPVATVPKSSSTSSKPGWYIDSVDVFNHMSAKETKRIVIDEKRTALGNQPLSSTNGVTSSSAKTLQSGTTTFTGYEGRKVSMTYPGALSPVEFTIIEVVNSQTVELVGDSVIEDHAGGVVFSIEAAYGDFSQYAVRVSYYTHIEAQTLQANLDAGRKRVITGNSLSRLFYPVFLDFRMRFKGAGTESDAREALLSTVQESQDTNFGVNDGARFEVSDLIASVYADNVANFVETPFEIKITVVNEDGTESVKWVSPSPVKTAIPMVIAGAVTAGDKLVACSWPGSAVALPESGKLFLGAFANNKETLLYRSFYVDGNGVTFFVLDHSVTAGFVHGLGEPLIASVGDYDPAAVITDGVIVSDKIHRPYFGTVVVEKLP